MTLGFEVSKSAQPANKSATQMAVQKRMTHVPMSEERVAPRGHFAVLPNFSTREKILVANPRKRKPPKPVGWTLHDIERVASIDGNEVLLGPRKIKIVRTIIAFEPYPDAGPGQWRKAYVDNVVEAALEAAMIRGITAAMFRALSAANFEVIHELRERAVGNGSET